MLADGRVFRGRSFGAKATVTGEVCFNTSMTGYQEVLTDPSYRGQIVAMTAPQIGNYGVNSLDEESAEPHVRGFVIEELSPRPSNWRSQEDLSTYLSRNGIPGVEGIDTRALTRHLRTLGAINGCLTTEGLAEAEALRLARECAGVEGVDFVREVTPRQGYEWDEGDVLSAPWHLPRGSGEIAAQIDQQGNHFGTLPPARHRIVAFDFGMKKNILRNLRRQGFQVKVMPATATAREVLAEEPDGVFLSNGPGDPAALDYAHDTVRELVGKKPIFGICLGHQILAYAFGGKTFKMKFGHRGANQPVKDLRTGKISITSQNHGFAVDPQSLPDSVAVTHVNLNDGTVAGMEHKVHPVFSVQYHPEAAPGPHDADYFFEQFAKVIDADKAK